VASESEAISLKVPRAIRQWNQESICWRGQKQYISRRCNKRNACTERPTPPLVEEDGANARTPEFEMRELRELVEAGHEKIEADQEEMKACREATEACLERM
jgi:hypothetical protein